MGVHMHVLDIQDLNNNTTRSAFRIHEIKQVFSRAYDTMMADLKTFERGVQQEAPAELKVDVIQKLLY